MSNGGQATRNGPAAGRSRRWIAALLAAAALALGGLAVLVASGRGPALRANHVLYLKNASRYHEALVEYETLVARHPREARSLPADFRKTLIEHAAGYYSQTGVKRREGNAYLAFLDESARRPELKTLARRKRLDFLALLDAKSTATLRAAHEILEAGGGDPEAYWWAAYSQYDPARPLKIPPEILQYRRQFENGAPVETGATQPVARKAYLSALLALSDGNWAEAALDLEQYRAGLADPRPLDLALGLACLKAGRPEAAIHHLRQYRQDHPADPATLRYLAGAYLSVPDYAWAAQTIHEIRGLAPTQEPLVFQDAFGAGGSAPLARLCGELARGGAYERDTALWEWLAELARTDSQRQAVDEAADVLIAAGADRPAEQAALLQYCLNRGRLDAAQRLTTGTLADATTSLRRQSIARIVQWYPSRKSAPAGAGVAENNRPLLNRDKMTCPIKLAAARGAATVVIEAQGYSSHGVWPIIHIDLGEQGERTIYLGDSRAQARPIVIPLRRPAEREMTLGGTISLINAEGESRSVMIVEARAF